jgi:hypothetical protein
MAQNISPAVNILCETIHNEDDSDNKGAAAQIIISISDRIEIFIKRWKHCITTSGLNVGKR